MTHRMVVITEGFKFGVDPCTAAASLDLFDNFGLKRESKCMHESTQLFLIFTRIEEARLGP